MGACVGDHGNLFQLDLTVLLLFLFALLLGFDSVFSPADVAEAGAVDVVWPSGEGVEYGAAVVADALCHW